MLNVAESHKGFPAPQFLQIYNLAIRQIFETSPNTLFRLYMCDLAGLSKNCGAVRMTNDPAPPKLNAKTLNLKVYVKF
jgi:hypothetical protein